MTIPDILDDPLANHIFLHLLYSGSRTNKQLTDDFSLLRIKTKRGVLVRGRTGYNYIRILTDKLADDGILRKRKVGDEVIYSANLDAKEGIMNDILFGIRNISGELAHHSLKFAADQINWFINHSIVLGVIESGIGEFNEAFDYEDLECRSNLFDYRMRLERNSRHIILAVLLFLCKVSQKVTDIDYGKLKNSIIKEGTEKTRKEIVDDITSFNWRVLPSDMRKDVPQEELDLYINRYRDSLEKGVENPVVSYWTSRTGMVEEDVLEFISFSYIIERLFTLLFYLKEMSILSETVSELEYPTGVIKVHVEEIELVKTVGLPRAKGALRKINTFLTQKKKKTIPEEVKKVVVYSGDIYLQREFSELIHIQYKKESDQKLNDRNVYLTAIGRKPVKVLSLNDALEIAIDKKRDVKVLDVVQLIHTVVTSEGTGILRRIKRLKSILEKSYNYEDYFSRLEEMYKMKLPK